MYKNVEDWFEQGILSPGFLLPTKSDYSLIPKEAHLKNKIYTDNPKAQGWTIEDKAIPKRIKDDYHRWFDFSITEGLSVENFLAQKYYCKNDVYLGFILSEWIRVLGIKNFVSAIKYNTGELLKAKPQDKTRILFENLSLVMLKGNTFQALAAMPHEKRTGLGESFSAYLYEQYILNFRQVDYLASDFQAMYEKIMDSKIPTGIRDEILPFYMAIWRKRIVDYSNDKTRKKYPDLPVLKQQINETRDVMGLK